jgi:rSAM/selenodomain-associated transferase 1
VTARALVVFVKAPRPGAVKTRLVPALGRDDAARLYRLLADHVLEATTPGAGEYERLVFFDPPGALDEMRAWLPGLRLVPQSGADLGERMSRALTHAIARGAGRAAVIGTDVPGLDRARVGQALDALDHADVTIGPSEDGGYYLLALARPCPDLFEGIEWSTPAVRALTLDRARSLGLRVHELPPLRDLDTPADLRAGWERLLPLLAGDPGLAGRIREALGREG